jgi:hypothetical protein
MRDDLGAWVAAVAMVGALGCGGADQLQASETVVVEHMVLPLPAPPTLGSPYRVGDAVFVSYGSAWYPAHVETVLPDGRWEISYDGWGREWNQLVGPDRVAKEAPVPPGPGRAIGSFTELEAGSAVMVSWNGSWYPGHVRAVTGRGVWIGYDGYGDEWDEPVGLDRLRHVDGT